MSAVSENVMPSIDKLKPIVRKLLGAVTEDPIFKEIEDSVKNSDHDHRLKIHSAISHHPSLNTGFGHNLEVNLGLAEHHEFNQLDMDLLQMLNTSSNNKELACALKAVNPPPEGNCPAFWDGILCWPQSPSGTNAVQKCFEELEGVKYDSTQNATRFCQITGVWANYSDYSLCSEKPDLPPGENSPYTELTSHLYLGGYSLSLAALFLAVGVFLYFKDLRCLRNTIHTNLMCTYILFGFIWILHLNLQVQVQKDNISCLLLVVFFHYFYLTNFFWMLVEGLYLYMLVVETFTGENITLRVYASIGWGAPAVFVTLWTVVRVFVPMEPGSSESTELAYISNVGVCEWMQEHPCDWIYKGPAMAGLALNLLFLIRIMWVLITKLRSANTLETQQYRKATKALLVLIPLLGITYLVVLYGPTQGYSAEIFDYARAILLSTQGFTVALFYCFLNTEVQNTIKHHYERWQAKRTVGGGRRYHYNYTKDWSPRSRTESIRLYSQPTNIYHKRESTASETTTTTLVGFAGQHQMKGQGGNRPPNSISPKLLQAYNSTTIENTAV